jgi:hypothetical protein
MNQKAVTDRPALMRADVEKGVEFALCSDNTDLAALMFHRVAAPLLHVRRTRNENFSHRQSLSLTMNIYGLVPMAPLRISMRAMSGVEGLDACPDPADVIPVRFPRS